MYEDGVYNPYAKSKIWIQFILARNLHKSFDHLPDDCIDLSLGCDATAKNVKVFNHILYVQ